MERPIIAAAALASLAMLVSAGRVRGDLARRGGEFPINTVTDGGQQGSRVVASPDGGFVVVWQSNGNVAARRFDANAQPLGPEFQVNSTPPDVNPDPNVAAAPDGSLLITWCAFMPPDQTGIIGRRLDADGTPDGPQFSVLDQGSLGGTAAVAAGNDQFVVAWTDDYTYGGFARPVSRNKELGSPFQVAETGNQYDLSAASASDGSYRMVWYDEPIATMQGRSFSGDQPAGDVFSIQAVSSATHGAPVVCSQDDGGFVVAWNTREDDVHADSINPVRYRRYGANAAPLTAPLPVTPEEIDFGLGTPDQGAPVLACGPGSDFVAAWADGTNQPYFRIRGRTFSDRAPSSDFTLGLLWQGADFSSLARLTGGDLLVTWTDCAGASGCDIFGQRFTFGPATDCPSDCNRDGRVTIDELVRAVNIALASPDALLMKQCLPADVNLDYVVTIDEIVQAVTHALGGC